MAFTRNAIAVNNIQGQPDQPIISATALKTLFDKTGSDEKVYNNDVLLVELEAPTAASSLGQNNGSYGATIQSAIDTITSAGVGTIPPDGTITNLKLATDVKIGSLASSTTTDKSSVIAVTNEINALVKTKATPLLDGIMSKEYAKTLENISNKYTLALDQTTTSTSYVQLTSFELAVVAGKKYRIKCIVHAKNSSGSYSTSFSIYLKSGSGAMIGGYYTISNLTIVSGNMNAIGAIGAAGSEFSTPNTASDCTLEAKDLFTCATSGVIALAFKSSNGANTSTVYGGSVMFLEEV